MIDLENDVIYAATSIDRILIYIKADGSLWRYDFSVFSHIENGVVIENRTGEITATAPSDKVMDKIRLPE